MKKIISLSMACTLSLLANETVDLPTIEVSEKINKKVVKNISKEEIKSADLAETLTKKVPSISLVRRSGIANDIILRGAKKDNINILIDESKIYGACPNRMDPATSHVLTNNIETVEVIEGPYDVENFGTLSGLVKVKTKKPTEELSGEVNLNFGSYGYKKGSFSVSGGNEHIKLLLSASKEESDQYEDGDGNDFLEQQIEKDVPYANRYKSNGLEAYEKETILTKAIFNIDDSSEVTLSYTANRSDNVLYPNTPMDADYDDSDIYTFDYTKRNLGDFSKELNLEYYYSKVDHPMSTALRNRTAGMMPPMAIMTNHMKSSIWGTKLKNKLDFANGELTVGLDTSTRNWRGRMYNSIGTVDSTSLTSTDTRNIALFSLYKKSFGALDLEVGARYDDTNIDATDSSKTDKNYNQLNGHVFSIYNIDKDTKIFAGVGKSSRVPDARELYYGATNNDLNATKNYEVDLGFEKTIGDFNIKTKLFYSRLDDYIYNTGVFENIDAKVYGTSVSGFYLINDDFTLDYGLAYQRGKKDGNYEDKDLAEIPPLKMNLALVYERDTSKFTTEVVAVDDWNNYDSTAKEQELSGYAVLNMKYDNQFHKNFNITLGVDNLFDKTYASTNTYQDVRYVETGGDRVLLNDPGRYFYVNLKYSF
ncbi:TonB-dependent receptor plug domain-containing protein [Halarcobacter bivalviorum]|uniref:TonB-dependent receptor n=1 Tax=Halarcobacter bivalviorum TaxID=663364 RepID=A0AAX2A4I7_9BACT|nr:TonB-dependent receptor [Halarcobacter bivalviorum]AXH12799.1 TonB-dependent receptor [Halarcobacter bivalviorum]RXK09077.1 TonB-dependent receptor [Halarcobacter bivalviorum]